MSEDVGHAGAGDRLRTRGGHTTRVALLVYNDAEADARVLKTAATLRAAGCEVRIIAVARERTGRSAGQHTLPDGVTRVRVPEFALASALPALAGAYQRVLARVRGAATPGVGTPTSSATSPGPDPAKGAVPSRTGRASTATHPTRGLLGRMAARVADLGMRAYLTVSLASYWRAAIADGVAFSPDVIHANDGNTLYPAMRIARHTGARILYDAHELWRHRNVRHRPLARHVDHLVERVGIRRAAAVITVSPSIAEWLRRTYRLRREPALVRNIPAAAPVPDRAHGLLRERAGLGPESPVIAYGGRITSSRGIEETIDALTHLPGAHLVLLGYGEEDYLAVVRRRALTAGVADRVHLIGAVPSNEVATALADADLSVVYVRPTCLSYAYSLPNKLFEAIHAGLPIVAADLPDTKAVVLEHGVGEIFAVDGGPDQMAAAMQRVLADPAAYRRAAREAATALTWEGEAAVLLAEYRRILS
ncbi:glycosyltransferase [Ruania alba]|uniref:Glycosyltransferase involved in cell wall bisynthesis n=1 Tax=Ruania alba TaxID=648782 RepID=A0A1H5N993_9MICO|nr:glycosyltransferase [Ruania alba]SEE98202.1 Glycosyltransferase involved in cell wall bisynthesis [Ruania alba]